MVRNGSEFIAGLRDKPREVWVSGRRVDDVTSDPVFGRPVRSIAELFDLQALPENRAVMSYTADESNEPAGTSFMVPKSHADLVKRRQAMKIWADATFGMVGRSPDYLNTVLMTFADGADFFGQRGAQFADNVRDYYRACRDRDLFLTHAIVNPQSDRSKGSTSRTSSSSISAWSTKARTGWRCAAPRCWRRTARPPTSSWSIRSPASATARRNMYSPSAFRPTRPGLRFICREPFDDGTQSAWDHPARRALRGARRGVRLQRRAHPVDRVFLYGDVKMGNALFAQASLRNHTGHQTAIRGLAKCQLLTGIAVAMTRSVKSDVFLHVQEQLGELLGYLQFIEAAILMAEQKAEVTATGAMRPAYAPLQALRYHLPKFYERMVQVTQVLSAGGLLISPTEADLRSEIGPDIERYYRGAAVDAERRIHLAKLAWDATGTQFGQRMLQYERYYAGDPVRVGAGYYLSHDVEPLLAQVERALGVQKVEARFPISNPTL